MRLLKNFGHDDRENLWTDLFLGKLAFNLEPAGPILLPAVSDRFKRGIESGKLLSIKSCENLFMNTFSFCKHLRFKVENNKAMSSPDIFSQRTKNG